jgi:hypothetical protein
MTTLSSTATRTIHNLPPEGLSRAHGATSAVALRVLPVFGVMLMLCLVPLYAADLLDAIAMVESSGNHAAVGDGGRARGAWQMHSAAWDDACRRLGVAWAHAEAHHPVKARVVAGEHLRWLREQFLAATGRGTRPADDYALWNLGVRGYGKRNFDITLTPAITRRGAARVEQQTSTPPQ